MLAKTCSRNLSKGEQLFKLNDDCDFEKNSKLFVSVVSKAGVSLTEACPENKIGPRELGEDFKTPLVEKLHSSREKLFYRHLVSSKFAFVESDFSTTNCIFSFVRLLDPLYK